MSLIWPTEDNTEKALPEITRHPKWVPDVGETIQLAFGDKFRAEEGYSNKTRIGHINTKVKEVILHEEDNLHGSTSYTYILIANIMGKKCWIKLSRNGLSRFDEAQVSHGNTGLPHEFYVLRSQPIDLQRGPVKS